MDILKYLSSLIGSNSENTFKTIYEIIEKNGFDLKKILQNVNISSLMPVLSSFFSFKETPDQEKKESNISEEKKDVSPLFPILSFADGTILSALDNYLTN